MSVMRSEMTQRAALSDEIAAINREFLRLLVAPALAGEARVLGLDQSVLASLRRLNAQQLAQLAATPLLLVEFRPLPGEGTAEAAQDYSPVTLDPEWREALRRFADHLLTCMWQFARQNPSFVAFTLGLDREASLRLAAVGFTGLSRLAAPACSGLRARLGDHQSCWPDLVRAARQGEPAALESARLSLIPMSLGRLPAVEVTR